MATIWYGLCGLLNLNYKDFITKTPECNKTLCNSLVMGPDLIIKKKCLS